MTYSTISASVLGDTLSGIFSECCQIVYLFDSDANLKDFSCQVDTGYLSVLSPRTDEYLRGML